MPTSTATKLYIFSLYRTFRRQIHLLPSEYLRQFFRIKLSGDVRRIFNAPNEERQQSRIKRVRKELRRTESANARSSKAFESLLRLAYGRIGPLRWEIMKPLLSDQSQPPPVRIISAVEKSRPPPYSPELTALLTSGVSRDKALTKAQIIWPLTMPERAKPDSEDARILGPFSKRREVNIRWRAFATEWKKVFPPLQVVLRDRASGATEADHAALARASVRPAGFQNTGLYEETVVVPGFSPQRPPLPRRERRAQTKCSDGDCGSQPQPFGSSPHGRFVRRRYQQLLAQLPILTYETSTNSGSKNGIYGVVVADSVPKGPLRHPLADPTLMHWLSDKPTSAQ